MDVWVVKLHNLVVLSLCIYLLLRYTLYSSRCSTLLSFAIANILFKMLTLNMFELKPRQAIFGKQVKNYDRIGFSRNRLN